MNGGGIVTGQVSRTTNWLTFVFGLVPAVLLLLVESVDLLPVAPPEGVSVVYSAGVVAQQILEALAAGVGCVAFFFACMSRLSRAVVAGLLVGVLAAVAAGVYPRLVKDWTGVYVCFAPALTGCIHIARYFMQRARQ